MDLGLGFVQNHDWLSSSLLRFSQAPQAQPPATLCLSGQFAQNGLLRWPFPRWIASSGLRMTAVQHTACTDVGEAPTDQKGSSEPALSSLADYHRDKRPAREPERSTAKDGFDRENDNDDDDDDDDHHRTLNGAGGGKEDTGPSKLLACPYYKCDSTKFRMQRTCQGPGWDSVRRVKEHLFRRHKLVGFGCLRCHVYFKDRLELNLHQQAEPQCLVRERDLLAGFDNVQNSQLSSRKRTRGVDTQADKWREIYRILFPGTREEDIPNPYYGADHPVADDGVEGLVDALTAFERSAQHELPQYIRQLLERGQYIHPRDVDLDVVGFSQDIVRWTVERLRQSHIRRLPSLDQLLVDEDRPSVATDEHVAQTSLQPTRASNAVDDYDPAGTGPGGSNIAGDGDYYHENDSPIDELVAPVNQKPDQYKFY